MKITEFDFDSNYPGLQILWNNFQEIELIPIREIVEGRKQSTLTKNIMSGRMIRVEYPVTVENSGNEIILTYKDPPKPELKGIEVHSGITTIQFGNSSLNTITGVQWFSNEDQTLQILVEHETWEYFPISSSNDDLYEFAREYRESRKAYRPDQFEFRNDLLFRYGGCVISGESIEAVVEACHIIPVKKKGKEIFSNGIPLRSDLHRLFDAGYFEINPESGRLEVLKSHLPSYYREMLERKGHIDSHVFENIKLALRLKKDATA